MTTPSTDTPSSGDQPPGSSSPTTPHGRLLITAGPTHEPIDAVRFLGNRSSGRMGIALATAAAARGWCTTLLLGPVGSPIPSPSGATGADSRLTVHRFRSCSDLQALLRSSVDHADVLVMAAAVADYRPRPQAILSEGKFRRSNAPLTLELEPTPDLLAEVAASRRADQLMVGFALEPRAELLESARAKLHRKKIDLVVGNPLETMDSETIEATVLDRSGGETRTPGLMSKADFAPWLLSIIEARLGELRQSVKPR